MSKNDRHGLSAKKFYGLIHLMDSRIGDNDGHGIILTTEKSNLSEMNQGIDLQNLNAFDSLPSMPNMNSLGD